MVYGNCNPFLETPTRTGDRVRVIPNMKEIRQEQIDRAIEALKEAYRKGDILEMKREGADTLAIVRITRKVEDRI